MARGSCETAPASRACAELELQLPALRAFAEHLQRADLRSAPPARRTGTVPSPGMTVCSGGSSASSSSTCTTSPGCSGRYPLEAKRRKRTGRPSTSEKSRPSGCSAPSAAPRGTTQTAFSPSPTPDVVGARAAAADAQAQPAAHQRVGGGAAGHGEVGRVVAQAPQRPSAPARHHLGEPVREQRGGERAAVVEHRVEVLPARRPRMALQEGGCVAGDGRVGGVGQAQLGEAGGARGPRRRVGGRRRAGRSRRGAARGPRRGKAPRSALRRPAASRCRPPPPAARSGASGAEQQLLRAAAGLHQRAELRGVEPLRRAAAPPCARAPCPCCRRRAAGDRPPRCAQAAAARPRAPRRGSSVRSVVPPPTSTTRTRRTSRSSAASVSAVDASPVVERGLRLLQEHDPGAGPPPRRRAA